MEGLLLRCARRVFSSAARLNRNRVSSRSFSSKEAAIINEMGVNDDLASMMKEAEASENWELFKSWMLKHKRNYECEGETLFRYKVFCGKLKEIEQLKKEYPGCTSGLNSLSDLTMEEFRRDYILHPPPISNRMRPRRRFKLR